LDELIQEQIDYYRARAPEYDRMLERAGAYWGTERDPPLSEADDRERLVVEAALGRLAPFGDVLEIACGTGWWTQRLAALSGSVTALDSSPEMLEANSRRADSPKVRRILADVFSWRPERRYDLAFFSFWLSHVPPYRFAEFWTLVGDSLAEGGRVFFVDEMRVSVMDEFEERLDDERGTTIRTLEDGRRFKMVKIYYAPADLAGRLRALGWQAEVTPVGDRYYYGVASAPTELVLEPPPS
jgi:SAM-dependent methyltransferase